MVAQMVKNVPAMWESRVRSPGWEDSPRRREWQPTPVFLSGELHEQRSLVGYSPWCRRVRHNWATNTLTLQVKSGSLCCPGKPKLRRCSSPVLRRLPSPVLPWSSQHCLGVWDWKVTEPSHCFAVPWREWKETDWEGGNVTGLSLVY